MKTTSSICILLCCAFWVTAQNVPVEEAVPDSNDIWSIDLDNVVVTAQYAPTDVRQAVHDIKVINQETITRRGAQNLEQLLQQEVNLRISQDLVLGSSLNILGISGQNVKILIDGVPMIGRQGGDIDLGQINLQDIERVEIVEGPLSVSYGTDALGGVINLITKKGQNGKVAFSQTTLIESRGENSYSGSIGWQPVQGLQLKFQGGYDHFDGYSEDTLRSVLWNPKKQVYGTGRIAYWINQRQKLQYDVRYFDEDVTNLGNLRRPTFNPYAFDDFYNTIRFDHSLTLEGNFTDQLYGQTILAYNSWDRESRSVRTDLTDNTEEILEGQQDTSLFTSWTLRSTLATQYASQWNFQLGFDGRYDQGTGQRILDTLSGDPNTAVLGDFALFGSARYQPLEKLQLEASLRYAYNTRYNAPLSPALHVRYAIDPEWTLRFSYANGFRSPDLKELFFNFIDINHYIVGNPDLSAETANNFQLSFNYLKRSTDHQVEWQTRLFYNHINNRISLFEFIETEDGFEPATDTSTLRFSYFNQAEYKTQGVSTKFSYSTPQLRISSALSIIGYYQPAHETFAEVDPFTYALELSNEINYHLEELNVDVSLFMRTNDKLIQFIPTLDEDGNSIVVQRQQDGFTMIDLSATKPIWNDKINITVGIKNLLNIQQTNLAGGGTGGAHSGSSTSVPIGPGRNYFVRAHFQF